MSGERYTLEQARAALGVSKSGLEGWMRRAQIKPTRDDLDMRLYWLSRAQVEQLAASHRRTLAEASTPDVQAIDAALSERLEALERRVSELERTRMPYRPPRPLPDVSFEASPSQNRTTDTLEGMAQGRLSKAEAARLISARHGADFGTAKGWPWPEEALASVETAEAWAIEYVAGRPPHKRPAGWR